MTRILETDINIRPGGLNHLYCLQDTSNVMGVMVLNNEGFPIRSNLDNTSTVQYGHMIADICVKVTLTVP